MAATDLLLADAVSMADDQFPMARGNGPFSYSRNSIYQRLVIAGAKSLIQQVVMNDLSPKQFAKEAKGTFVIADLGCSVGPNTLLSVQNILEALGHKYKTNPNKPDDQNLEFLVFFNDHAANDFNTLLTSLPQNKNYHAAAVPGSFHNRVFPRHSLHLAHCSYGLHFLSRVPKAVADKSSPAAWNKGRITYGMAAGDAVISAYRAQHGEDVDRFLHARSEEVVPGGLLIIVIPARPDGVPHDQVLYTAMVELLGSCLMELAGKGVIEESKVDSFNMPFYISSAEELAAAVERNGCFSIAKMEKFGAGTTSLITGSCKAKDVTSHMRAITEVFIAEKFGESILDQLFNLYSEKFEMARPDLAAKQGVSLFLALKREEDLA